MGGNPHGNYHRKLIRIYTTRKVSEEISKNLVAMKAILYGDGEANEPSPELVAQLSQEVYQNDLLQLLVQNIGRLDFEVFSLYLYFTK